MTTEWVATIELDEPAASLDRIDGLMDALAPWDVSVSTSVAGRTALTISMPGSTLAQASRTALAVVAECGVPIGMHVMTEADRDTRLEWEAVPDLVSIAEAAHMLGVSRQRVDQMIASGKLPTHRVGGVRVLPRAAVGRAAPIGKEHQPRGRP